LWKVLLEATTCFTFAASIAYKIGSFKFWPILTGQVTRGCHIFEVIVEFFIRLCCNPELFEVTRREIRHDDFIVKDVSRVKSVFSVVGEDGGDASPLLFESCVEFAALGAHQYTVRGYA